MWLPLIFRFMLIQNKGVAMIAIKQTNYALSPNIRHVELRKNKEAI